jgi:hypothetical protein
MPWSVTSGHDRQAAVVGYHREITSLIGSVDTHAEAAQPVQRQRGGVAVVVVRSDADQRGPGACGGQKIRILAR